ncbi:MAG: cupin domain-containing protein [Candidatus Bathyarchaeia archaeon]|jgi:quercetin dioxygenase-like cupin family protein
MMMLKAIKLNEAPSEDTVGGIFEGGTVNVKTLIDKQLGAEEIKAAIVTFSPGARTKLHVHDHEQVLYILSGKGIVANEHEELMAMPGMIFFIPAGEKHWHGATPESSFSHLYVYNSKTETTY